MSTIETATGVRSIAGRRSANQDAVFSGLLPDGRELLVVADGMGGHKGGEVASRQAIDALVEAVSGGQSLQDSLMHANAMVRQAAHDNPACEGMGTTLVALLRSGERYQIANVGDSRAYSITGNGIQQITADHSFMAEALAAQQMTAEEASRSRWRNALTRAIGTEETVEVDVFGPFEASQPHVVLLCSDGLHGSVNEEVIRQRVLEISDPELAAEKLINEAYDNGSKDNISVAIMRLGHPVAVATEPVMPPQPATWTPRSSRLIMGREERRRTLLQRLFTLFT